MAIRADFYVQIALMSGTRRETAAACAQDADFVVCRMDGCLHVSFNLDSDRLILQELPGIQQLPSD
jgi:hypothetical protein